MVEVALNVAAEPIVTWSAYGTLLERQGNRGPNGAPQGVYACRGDEQWVAVSILTDDQWRSLCAVLGDPEWALEPRLATRAVGARTPRRRRPPAQPSASPNTIVTGRRRVARRRACTRRRSWDQNLQDELPQLVARGFTQWLDHPVAGTRRAPGDGATRRPVRHTLPRPRADRRPAHRRSPPRRPPPRRRRPRRAGRQTARSAPCSHSPATCVSCGGYTPFVDAGSWLAYVAMSSAPIWASCSRSSGGSWSSSRAP